jgi:hypothetical protein
MDLRKWHIASYRCDTEFSRYPGMADIGQASTNQARLRTARRVHTDHGNVTLLATDAVGGLMVRDRSGRWLDAPVMPDAFICNIGDCLMRWSNDVYVSTPHKVVSPPAWIAIQWRSSSTPIRTPWWRVCRPAQVRNDRPGISRSPAPISCARGSNPPMLRRRPERRDNQL